jgi:RNA polymerase sigma-70 factor (ECF subfamily)
MTAVATIFPVSHAGLSAIAAATDSAPELWTRDEFQREVRPHLPRLYRICVALCRDTTQAQDLLQDSLVKAYVGRRGFEARGSFIGWLLGIVRHEHDDLIRTTARRRSLMRRAIDECILAAEDLLAAPPPNPETWTGISQQGTVLLDCLQTIPEPYRIVVWLCDVEQLSHDEIAQTLGIAVGTVKSRHARGLSRLRTTYERRVSGKFPRGGT